MSKYKPAVIGKIFIDATNCVAGRLSSVVSRYLSEGYEVYIFNAEKAVILGNKKDIIENFKHRVFERGDWYKGPFYPKRPDRILRRIIRGMLPKGYIGRVLLRRVKVFVGVPDEYKNVELIRPEEATLEYKIKKSNPRYLKYMYIGEISKLLGANF